MRNNQKIDANRELTNAVARSARSAPYFPNDSCESQTASAVTDGIDSIGAVRYQHAGTVEENEMKIVHRTTSFAIIIIYHVIPVKL